MKVDSADEFYSLMGELSSDMMEGTIFNSDDIIKVTALIPSGRWSAADSAAHGSVHDLRKAVAYANHPEFYWVCFDAKLKKQNG